MLLDLYEVDKPQRRFSTNDVASKLWRRHGPPEVPICRIAEKVLNVEHRVFLVFTRKLSKILFGKL
jgi:hypothetical protein